MVGVVTVPENQEDKEDRGLLDQPSISESNSLARRLSDQAAILMEQLAIVGKSGFKPSFLKKSGWRAIEVSQSRRLGTVKSASPDIEAVTVVAFQSLRTGCDACLARSEVQFSKHVSPYASSTRASIRGVY